MVWQSLRKHIGSFTTAVYRTKTGRDISCIIGFVLLANILLIAGLVNNNPLNTRSGLQIDGQSGVLSGQNTIDPNDGFTTQSLGVGAMKQLVTGHIPWWNHYEQVGAPLAGEMQSAALFPFTLLMLLPGGYIVFRMALELLAGVGTYLLLKRLGCSRAACVAGAVAFSLNGTFAWLTNAAANPVAFLPWLVLGVEHIVTAAKNKKRSGFRLFALSLTLSIYAGFPETAFIDMLFVAGWAVVRLFQATDKQVRVRFLQKLCLGGVIGMLLAAPILAAFLAYLPYANVGGHASNGPAAALTLVGLPALLFPYIYGPIFGYANIDASGHLGSFWGSVGGFTSLLVVFLAIAGFLQKRQRILLLLITTWIVLAVCKMFNVPVLGPVIGLIPGISHTAFYRYVPPSIEFGLIVAMAFGIDALSSARQRLRIKAILPGLLVILGLLAVILPIAHSELLRLSTAPRTKYWGLLSIVWGIGTVLLVILITKLHYKTRYLLSLLVIAEALLFFAIPQLSASRHTTITEGPVRYLQQHQDGYRFYTLGPIQPNYGAYWQIASINTNNLPIAKDWGDYVNDSLDSNSSPLIFTGFSMLSPSGVTPLQAFLQNMKAYEYVGVKYIIGKTGTADIAALSQAGLKQVYTDKGFTILQLLHPQPYFDTVRGDCTPQYVSFDSMNVHCHSNGEILRRELYMPGWQAVDQNGKKLPLAKTGKLFQSIDVTSTTRQVTFHYQPPYMMVAYGAFVLGVVALLGGYVQQRFRGKTQDLRVNKLK